MTEFLGACGLIANQQMADTTARTTGQTKKCDQLLHGIMTKIDPTFPLLYNKKLCVYYFLRLFLLPLHSFLISLHQPIRR